MCGHGGEGPAEFNQCCLPKADEGGSEATINPFYRAASDLPEGYTVEKERAESSKLGRLSAGPEDKSPCGDQEENAFVVGSKYNKGP